MKGILRKLKLVDSFATNLSLSKQDFVERLSAITEDGNPNFSLGEQFSTDEYEYIGRVNLDGFKIRRRFRFFNYRDDSNIIAKGNIIENNDYLTIETEINSFGSYNIFFLAITILVFSFLFMAVARSIEPVSFDRIIFLILFGAFWLLILYLNMRAGVKKFKYNFERELFYLTKEND